jgi:hypothetical protein
MRLGRREIYALFNGIEFRFFQPLDKAGHIGSRGGGMIGVDLSNTVFRDGDAEIRRRLMPLLQVQSMSTIATAHLINRIVAGMDPDEAYLNVGCWQGYSFLAGVIERDRHCIGVDNFSQFGGPREAFLRNYAMVAHERSEFHEMDYEEFLRTKLQRKIGFYFYDGEHSYLNQRKGLDLIRPYLSDDAIILVDDTNWPEARQATLDFVRENHPHYELLIDCRTAANGHPTFWNGIMILQRHAVLHDPDQLPDPVN